MENTNNHEVLKRSPFVVSYWADNYLEFDSYKLARMFNGLVGYGEFLYKRDNNYSRMAVNNFSLKSIPTKSGYGKIFPVMRGTRN